MDAKTARTHNIRRLVADAGGPTAFVERVGGRWSQAQVSQWISETRPKSIGHALARDLERALGLFGGALDHVGVEVGGSASIGVAAEAALSVTKPRLPAGTLRPIVAWSDPSDLPPDRYVFLPRLDYRLSAGDGGPDPDAADAYDTGAAFRADFVAAEGWSPRTHWTMRAQGESMEPLIQDGAPVVIDTSAAGKMVRSGSIYALVIDGEIPLLKRLDRLPGNRYRVRSDNPDPRFAPFDVDAADIEIVGRAVWTPVKL